LRIWRYQRDDVQPCYLVNAFAANDPESTALVLDRVAGALGCDAERCVGLLSLRPDRGDRTLQWLTALQKGFLKRFGRLYVIGFHARALQRRLKGLSKLVPIEVIGVEDPAGTTQTVLAPIRVVGGVLFGFGNIAGSGEALIAHWNAVGDRFEV
jgi:hypothetical protein